MSFFKLWVLVLVLVLVCVTCTHTPSVRSCVQAAGEAAAAFITLRRDMLISLEMATPPPDAPANQERGEKFAKVCQSGENCYLKNYGIMRLNM